MYLRSPAEHFIKYLLLSPDECRDNEIFQKVEELGLDGISTKYIGRLRERLKPPNPFHPTDKGHMPSRAFLFKEGVDRMFLPDKDMKTALHLVGRPRVKEVIESTLLSGAPSEYVCSVLLRTQRTVCSPKALDLYEHYFWNLELLDSSQMRVLLQLRYNSLEGDSEGVQRMLKGAYYQDPRRVAAELPYSPTSTMLTQMRMGMQPGKGEVGIQMLDARRTAMLKAIEAVHRDGPMDSKRSLDYFQGARILTELLEVVVKPDQNLNEQLSAISLRTDTRPLPSLQELSAGKHTADLQPTKEIPDERNAADAGATTGDPGSDGGAEEAP